MQHNDGAERGVKRAAAAPEEAASRRGAAAVCERHKGGLVASLNVVRTMKRHVVRHIVQNVYVKVGRRMAVLDVDSLVTNPNADRISV